MARSACRGLSIARQDLRFRYLGQLLPAKPIVLELLVNHTCNSRCSICYICSQKWGKEFSPDELALVLSDQLFDRLGHVCISGAEPTLRSDLPEICRVLVEKQPPLVTTQIVTNGMLRDQVISRILSSAEVCRDASLRLDVVVSLDGIGEIHDRIRGCEGNFQGAVEVVRYFRDETDIPISVSCTVSRDNIWSVDEVLDFCRREGVYGRFRVAEFIRRLHNDEQVECIRNFTEREAYHLGLFFAKLEYAYEKSPTIRRTYRNIRRMLMEGTERSTRCPWQATAVTLDCKGQLLYCAPRSSVLGSCLEESAQRLYLGNVEMRKAIIRNDCSSCIHDYHADQTLSELWSSMRVRSWRWRLSLDRALNGINNNPPPRSVLSHSDSPRQFLIIGWYGTETAGDKAILGEIIHRIRNAQPDSSIMLASLHPYVSQWTVKEIGHPDVEVVPVYSRVFWQRTAMVDEVIMGGGPLMHLEALGVVLQAFLRAKRAGHRTRIAGCGIGPLDRGQRYEDAVRNILLLADSVELRDSESVAWASRVTGRKDIMNSGDPAVGFVQRWMRVHPVQEKCACLNLYLRDWTREYQGSLSDKEFENVKTQFELQLGLWIHELCAQLKLRPRLLPMHHLWVGNDDRDFNRRFARAHLAGLDPVVEAVPLSLLDILASMQEAALSLCMRYHSVLFANTLRVPFFAIDYTQGGKITAYLRDHGGLGQMVCLRDIADGKWYRTLPKAERELG